MTRVLVIAFALLVSRAAAVDLKARSVSSSKQFIIFCPDAALRGRVVGFVEEVKADTLRLLGESDRWKIPVVVSLQPARVPSDVRKPVSMVLQETPEGPKIEIDVSIGTDPAAVNLQRHIVRAVLLEFAYRERPVRGGQAIVEPPWWVVAATVESIREQDHGVDSALFRRLVETNKMPTIEHFLSQHPDDLGEAAQAMDDACAMALVQLLIEQPGGQNSLVRLLRQWPELHDDPIAALTRTFPSLGEGSAAVQKWWTLNLARLAASDRYKGLAMEDTDRALNTLLDVTLTTDKAGTMHTFHIGEFDAFLKIKGAREALASRHGEVLALGARANAIFRPVVAGYEEILALLMKGRTRGVRERMVRVEIYREAVLHRMGEIADYLNWYEATQMGVRSDAFDGFLRAAREVERDPGTSGISAAIKRYLDEMEKEFAPLTPGE